MDKYRIDYSKWDRIVASDDDEEDEERSSKPRVTVLDRPTQVTFGGGGGTGAFDTIGEKEKTAAVPSTETKDSASTSLPSRTMEHATTKPLSKYGIPLTWSEKGAIILKRQEDIDSSSTDLSFSDIHYCWSQDRAAVHIRIPIDNTISAKDCEVVVSNLLPFRDRHCAVLTHAAPPQLVARHSKSDDPLLKGTLSHPVYITDDDDGVVDWSLETIRLGQSEKRYLLILLNKATPMDGITLWWKQCFQEETVSAELPPATPQQIALQEAWTTAHAQFREAVATRTKHTV